MTEALLTAEEVAELLGVKKSTLVDWRYKGTGPAFVRHGKRFVGYTRAAVTRWVDANTVEAHR